MSLDERTRLLMAWRACESAEITAAIAAAIRDAVDAETEACALLADRHAGHTDASCAELVASMIRQRAEARSEAGSRPRPRSQRQQSR